MSFIAKTDPFSLSGAGKFLALVSVTDGKSASVAEARNENGDVVATTMYGVQYSPAYEYRVAGSGNVAIPSLGSVVTTTMADGTSVKLVVTGWALNTAAGSENTFSLNAESVPSGVTAICPYVCDCGTVAVGPCMHAKSLFSAFTLGGTGCHLQSANYAGACDLGRATKDGDTIACGITNGRITASVTIIQTGSTVPTLTAGTGWEVTSPLSCTNPDADYPTWTATLVKYLAAAAPNT